MTRRTRRIFWIVAVALALPSTALAQDAEARQRFEGTWQLDHPPAEGRRILDAAVERAVSAMSFFVRGIARGRLRDGTHLNRRIELSFAGPDRITVRFDSRDRYTTTIGRTERRRDGEEEMRVTQRFRPNGALEQVFETDSGTRWYVYTPLADGRMRVETTTGSPRMPQPMYFVLDYRRR